MAGHVRNCVRDSYSHLARFINFVGVPYTSLIFLFQVKGFQVAPAELEAIIRAHPKIADCAVIGIPDPITGELPKAFIVPQPNQTVSSEEIMEFVNSKVVAFKKITQVQTVEAIPKNPAGKILRKDLKAKYC